MEAMELDVKLPPPPQVPCTQDQLAQARGVFARVEARMAEIAGNFDEIIAVIDLMAEKVRELRRQRAEGRGAADLAGPLRAVEWAFAGISTVGRQAATMRGDVVEVAREGLGIGVCGGGGEAVEALAAGLQRIRIDLGQRSCCDS